MTTNENAAEVCQPQAAQMQKHCAAILGEQPAEVKPHFRYPSPETVHGRVLGAVLRGERHSTLSARPRFHTTALTQAVQKLKDTGWAVRKELVTVVTGDQGRTARIAIYFLDAEAIAAAGDLGRQYAEECASIEAERRVA